MVDTFPVPASPSSRGDLSSHLIVTKDVDVAIVGNGPSGIFLSLLLSGHRPYYRGGHPDHFLDHRLSQHPDQSILDQDLEDLSEGLEGRSNNQLALLMDTLLRPNADIGQNRPSTLEWTFDQSKHISHVVIGNCKPGGSWHSMKGEIQSLSLGSWLELPIYTFQDWRAAKGGDNTKDISTKRVHLSSVAEYYEDYVLAMGLQENMMNGVQVTKVKECPFPIVCTVGSPKLCTTPFSTSPSPIKTSPCALPFHTVDSGRETGSSCPTSPSEYSYSSDSDDDDSILCNDTKRRCHNYKWCLKGTSKNGDVIIHAKNLVLACGVNENPRLLGVPGEKVSFVCHYFADFCQKLDAIDRKKLVVVVGVGLSAADAVLLCLSKGLKVVHVFRRDPLDPSVVYNKMPDTIYPEYRQLLKLMKGELVSELYEPASRSRVCEFTAGNCCKYQNHKGKTNSLSISLAGVFIGSEANIKFLPKRLQSQLALNPSLPINAKNNPIAVDPITFESESWPSLYALGPLAGDHFVRFVLGGGLGVCRHLQDKLQSAP